MAASNDTIRDALANTLLDIIENGGSVLKNTDGEVLYGPDGKPLREPASAAYLAVARAFVKDNPPASLPTTGAPTGVLKGHLAKMEKDGKALPFDPKQIN